MACNQEANQKFVPFKFNNFSSRGYIHEGIETATPYRKGVADLAQNNNTLWSNIGCCLVNDNRDDDTVVTTSAAPETFTFAYYKVKPPLYLPGTGTTGRRMLTVYIYAKTTVGNWTFTATTPEGNATSASSASAGAWATVDVPCTNGAVEQLKLEMTCASICSASVMSVIVYVKKDSTVDITSVNTPYDADVFIPADIDFYDADSPLSVVSLQHLQYNNEAFFKYTRKAVVTYCSFANLGTSSTITTAGTYLCTSANNTNGRLESRMEWIYFPRQGVKTLSVYVIGHVASWASASDDATVRIGFKDQEAYAQDVIDGAASAFTATWPLNGLQIPVPNGPGPHFLELRINDLGKRAYITGVCIMED